MKILIVVGARPNFMKVSPIINEFNKYKEKISYELVHTGQHFDKNMSDNFFNDLGIPHPDINLNINGGSISEQIGRIMIEFDKLLKEKQPDFVLVVGDVNSTTACAIVTKQNGIKLIHVESGLRSFDMSMPEEINRLITDRISDYLFVTEKSGIENLKNEGKKDGVNFVGNTMIDCLVSNLEKIKSSNKLEDFGISKGDFALITIHRPSNVDNPKKLEDFLKYFSKLSENIKLLLPLHPRTKGNIEKFGLSSYLNNDRFIISGPLGYLDFINLLLNSKFILTDSGGIQEESTFLKIPCLTLRENTERPITCEVGSNILVGLDYKKIDYYVSQILNGTYKEGQVPEFWDGKSSERIVKIILR